jgi:hypothetical protein
MMREGEGVMVVWGGGWKSLEQGMGE